MLDFFQGGTKVKTIDFPGEPDASEGETSETEITIKNTTDFPIRIQMIGIDDPRVEIRNVPTGLDARGSAKLKAVFTPDEDTEEPLEAILKFRAIMAPAGFS